jgi:hypothetical protein
MQFTSQETKLIERLRKDEQRWSRNRWILLATVIIFLAIYGFIGSQLVGMIKSEGREIADDTKGVPVSVQLLSVTETSQAVTFAVAFFWPMLLLGLCVAGWLITLLIRDWHGKAERMLLLRLFDAQQKETSTNEHAA